MAMIFKKGDRVKFLNDIGGGVVTRVDHQTVYVENEDGFEVPATMSQLLQAEVPQAEATPFTAVYSRPVASAEPVIPAEHPTAMPSDYIDLSEQPDDASTDPSVSILLAWIPQRKKNGKAAYDLYLVNDCSYLTMYVAAMIADGAYRGIQAGMLENETSIHLCQIDSEKLKTINSIRLEILFFKKGAYLPQEPMRYELKIDEFYLTDVVNYVTNTYFDEKALIFNISNEYLMSEIENVARETQKEFEKQKRQADRPLPQPPKKTSVGDMEEVDLHIEQLVDHPQSLSPAEKLDTQMQHFTTALETALSNRTKRIVFIHGVGNGRLRLEIQRTLSQKYPKLQYQDAPFKEYGYGATMVIIHR